jgi:hypothetical protein
MFLYGARAPQILKTDGHACTAINPLLLSPRTTAPPLANNFSLASPVCLTCTSKLRIRKRKEINKTS